MDVLFCNSSFYFMKRFIAFNFFTIFSLVGVAQTQSASSNKCLLYLSIGKSFTGSGDQTGLLLLNGFSKDYNKWNLSGELATTLYNDSRLLFFSTPTQPDRIYDGSIRNTTYGIQVNFIGSRRIIKGNKNHLNIGLGPVIRYQSTSIADSYTVLYPALTNLPIPVLYFDHTSKQNTYAAGGIIKLLYSYDISNKLNVGTHFSFQTDSNDDTISNLAFQIGYRL